MGSFRPFEQGGCCLVRTYAEYVVPSPISPPNVTRYRAIAPKPIAPKPSSPLSADAKEPPSSSESTLGSQGKVALEQASGATKGRKRSAPPAAPARSPKQPRYGAARMAKSPMAMRDARYGLVPNSSLARAPGIFSTYPCFDADLYRSQSYVSKATHLPMLLPKEPLPCSSSSTISSTGFSRPSLLRIPNSAPAAAPSSPRLVPLLPKPDSPSRSQSTCSSVDQIVQRLPVATAVDTSYLEQVYGAALEPVMLTDQDHRLLWSNATFKKEAGERLFGTSALMNTDSTPDQLAFPVPVSSVNFQAPFQSKSQNALLWIFLRKPGMNLRYREGSPESVLENALASSSSREGKGKGKVLTPQPVRPVGSVVSMTKLQASGQGALGLRGSFETVQRQFDRWASPVLLTDLKNRVRWVNSAFKQLVGQPECAWMATAVGSLGEDGGHVRLTGGISIFGLQELQSLPASLVCDARVQWAGRSMDAPCSGTRVDSASSGVLGYVWCLDVAARGASY